MLPGFLLNCYALSAFEQPQQNKHALAEAEVAQPGAGIDKAFLVLVIGTADAGVNSERFQSRNHEQQKAGCPGSVVQHQPDAVEKEENVQQKIDDKGCGAAVNDNDLLAAGVSAAVI